VLPPPSRKGKEKNNILERDREKERGRERERSRVKKKSSHF